MRLEWSIKHSVNVKIIDDQHKHFIDLINNMFEALENREVEQVVNETLDELVSYGLFHFETEERLMEEAGYPDIEHQREEHRKLVARLTELLEERKTAPDVYKFYYELLDFLKGWLIDHLVGEDRKFSECLNEHGIY